MRRALRILLPLLAILAEPAAAQLSITPQFLDPSPSPYVADWRANPNTLRFIIVNPTATTYSTRIAGTIDGDRRGRVAESATDAAVAPVMVPPGTMTINAVDAHIIDEGAVRYSGSTRSETERSGRLPEDNYRFCVHLAQYENPAHALSPEGCTAFAIRQLLPPVLIAPANGSKPQVLPVFQWSMTPIRPGVLARYRLTLVELDPGQTNAANAMETNLPLAEVDVMMPAYQYMPSDPQLASGRTYAWRVQAFDPSGASQFQNGGRSEVWSFVYKPFAAALAADSIAVLQSGLTATLPALTGEPWIPPFLNVIPLVFNNCTIKGNLWYGFAKGDLLPELRAEISPEKQTPGGGLKPLPYASVRLVRCYKTIPPVQLLSSTLEDKKTGTTYDISPVVVATGSSDASGTFQFDFIDGDHTAVVTGADLYSHSGTEFWSQVKNATLYKYYRVEVVNPYYCSSGSEITVEPGATASVNLSSLVRTYNLDVTVKDQERATELGATALVYAARLAKEFTPAGVPADEGTLPSKSGGVNPDNPAAKFSHDKLGWVISAAGTQDAPSKGRVLLTRLVRNTGGLDAYFLSARTPATKPDGNYNDLYYHDASFAAFISHTHRLEAPKISLNYQEEVVQNTLYDIPTFTAEIAMTPRLPRMFGQVKRSDSKKPIADALVLMTGEAPSADVWDQLLGKTTSHCFVTTTDAEGYFEIDDIEPTGSDWTYTILFFASGFTSYTMPGRPFAKGYQAALGVIELDPKLIVTRKVVDEQHAPLPGVEGVLGDGAKRMTDANGVFLSPAVPGYQSFHLEKRPKYADKDSSVTIKDSQFELLGAMLSNAIVMFEAKRRLAVRVRGPGGNPIEGAVVVLEDFYTQPTFGQYQVNLPSPYKQVTNAEGEAQFAYDSPSDVAHLKITVPNSDYVPAKRTFSGITEGGVWTQRSLTLSAGGRVSGTVYAGAPKALKGKNAPGKNAPGKPGINTDALAGVNLPLKGVRVFVDGYPELVAFTNADGAYDLRGVPAGVRTIKASKASSDPGTAFIGEAKTVTVAAFQQQTVDFHLTTYAGMDITKLLGFPIEIDKLQELPGGKLRIDGAFVSVPGNPAFARKETDERYEFTGVDLTPLPGSTPQPAKPVAGSVPLLAASIDLLCHGQPVELVAAGAITAQPPGGVFTKGVISGRCRVMTGSFAVNSNELQFIDGTGTPQELYAALPGASPSAPPVTSIGALTSGGDFSGGDILIASASGADAAFKLYLYNVTADARSSRIASDGLHFAVTVRVSIPGCGSSMSSACDVAFPLGDVHVKKTGLVPLDPSSWPPRDIALQMWTIHAQSFSILNGYITFDGQLRAPLVQNQTSDATSVKIPFTGMQLRPGELTGGNFAVTELDLLGIATMQIAEPPVLGSDSKSWFLAAKKPVIPASQPGGKDLEGLDPSASIMLNTFYLRSDGTKDISASNDPLLIYDVGSFVLTTFQFGYDTKPYMSMQGGLTLVGIPDLAPQFARVYYTGGGTFGMDGVFLTTPYNAGGVRLTIANGMLTPDGFLAEGDWGQYHNRITLEGTFAFNMHFRHRAVSGGYSTVAEIINATHAPPQNQKLFGNASGPDVVNMYGRTQLEADQTWSTHLAGWYSTPELAGKDSMYYDVAGVGGHGTVAMGTATMKMKGANGGLGMLLLDGRSSFPKGPAPEPPPPEALMPEATSPAAPLPDDESPFTGMTFTPDFSKMALIGALHVEKEISPGTSFKGDIVTVVSFGSEKFWSFFAAGEGQIANPPCMGSAAFLAGMDYAVGAQEKQLLKDYSISGQPLPAEFATMTGFFTQVAIVMPIPNTPNFDITVAIAHLGVHCTMGGEGRLGLNFSQGTSLFFGIYSMAKVEVVADASVSLFGLAGVSLAGHAVVEAGAGGSFTFNNDAGASFGIIGMINGELTMHGCASVLGIEKCFDATVFQVGGTITGSIGATKNLDISPTFSFLGL